jgi:hypothetical protein
MNTSKNGMNHEQTHERYDRLHHHHLWHSLGDMGNRAVERSKTRRWPGIPGCHIPRHLCPGRGGSHRSPLGNTGRLHQCPPAPKPAPLEALPAGLVPASDRYCGRGTVCLRVQPVAARLLAPARLRRTHRRSGARRVSAFCTSCCWLCWLRH